MKGKKSEIKTVKLDTSLFYLHKKGEESSNFGMDNSQEFIEDDFGLYSSTDMKRSFGPVKTQYYRIGFFRAGRADINLGIETYHPERNSVVLGFPGQVFSLDASDDAVIYYMLFKESFMADTLLLRDDYPFFGYLGVQSFPLEETEASEVEALIFKINEEVKMRRPDCARMIRLYIQIILTLVNRRYQILFPPNTTPSTSSNALFRSFVNLVGHHFMTLRKVSDYAKLLHVSNDHLNRTIKSHSEKTAGELIDAMILTEAKAYLLHTEWTNAEIAYQLAFADPSHFNKFFKKLTQVTPTAFRSQSKTDHTKSFSYHSPSNPGL